MYRLIAKLAGSVLLLTLLAGCQSINSQTSGSNLISNSHFAASELVRKAGVALPPGASVIATSFVSIDSLESSSTLGRIVGEQVATGLADAGYRVIELKMRDRIFINAGAGEFMLSRELRHISNFHEAQAVAVGTYAVGTEYLYINTRLIDAGTNLVIASMDYRLPMNRDVRQLLRNSF
ncbi:FlgO family outer membrane protein [Kistimonas scapharcae]|uniref:FlgO family outer membrane protein n=1 Tax=Kistimonas scapharcae TaxID=1036133 RepID=A0ABP8UWW2_9GAMM